MSQGQDAERDVRVDARQLEAALLTLRRQIMDAALPLETDGVAEARSQRRALLTQIDDYLLPRIRATAAPLLVALVGSTGAGKSTLVNSIVGAQVSVTGIRRPTTNSPVLACHPDDIDWFAENVFLPSMPRVRQAGLAMPGKDGLLVLAGTEGIPPGIALLDTPDIDSVVKEHHEFARQFLDAADLWLLVTTATRYADAPMWEMLREAQRRDAAMGIVLSRVPLGGRAELIAHFSEMLEDAGLGGTRRFVIPETSVSGGLLPPAVYAPVRQWLLDLATAEERRVAVLSQTMSGVLDMIRVKVPELAGQLAAQAALRGQLREVIESRYAAALSAVTAATGDGSLLRGEVLARWQDLAGTGELAAALHARHRLLAARPRRRVLPARAQALKAALSAALESLIVSLADRAAEEASARWRDLPGGTALLDRMAVPAPGPAWRRPAAAPPGRTGSPFDDYQPAAAVRPPQPDGNGTRAAALPPPAPGRSSPDLPRRAARAVSSWQDHVMHLARSHNTAKRSIARLLSFDDQSLALVLIVALLGPPDGADPAAQTSAAARQLLTSVLGQAPLREITRQARADLGERLRLLFDEEMLRFAEVVDEQRPPDESAAVRLHEATRSLEAIR